MSRHMHQPVENRLRRTNRASVAVLSVSFAAMLSLVGCGYQYRPVVTAIGPVGPAGQQEKFAIAVSSPSLTTPGLVTNVDFSGDTVLSTPQIVTNPSYFVLNTTTATSSQGYVVDTDGLLDLVPLSNPTTLLTSEVTQTTLPTGTQPVSLTAVTPASGTETVFIPNPAANSVSALNASTVALYDTVGVQGGGSDPVYVVAAATAPRVYVISQNAPGGNGQVDSIETVSTTSLSDSAQIPVGIQPVYGVMTASTLRAFIMNEGSGTVSVINVPSNQPDVFMPTITVGASPVWADFNTVDNELVVLNQGDGVHAGSLSIINIPLCNATAQATNPNCSATNPVDATNFGQILATVPVGINPSMVSVLQGTVGNTPTAYVINQSDSTGTCPTNPSAGTVGAGTVTVVNLETTQVVTTICGISGTNATAVANGTANLIFGHPNSVAATSGQPTGKVYVTSSDNQYLSVIYTGTNTVQTHIPLQGNGLRVLVSAP
jgi:YVTN family beta-propeller protein